MDPLVNFARVNIQHQLPKSQTPGVKSPAVTALDALTQSIVPKFLTQPLLRSPITVGQQLDDDVIFVRPPGQRREIAIPKEPRQPFRKS
jgi:hypothetical protein